jgi:DNA polymerase
MITLMPRPRARPPILMTKFPGDLATPLVSLAMPKLHWDLETRSTLDLTEVGVRRYATHPTTGVWCISFAVDDGPVQIWFPPDPIPEVFFEAERNPDWTISAHNDAFEREIAEFILAPLYSWPLVPIARHRCTMAVALACALPGKLEKVAEALSLPLRKDPEGARLMRLMSKPRKARHGEDPKDIYWHDDDPEKLARLGEYCRRDTEVEREVERRLPPLTDAEQALWVLDAKINARGFHTDGLLLEAASHIAAAAYQAVQNELAQITKGALASTNQTEKLQSWLADHGCAVANIQKGTLSHALRRKDLDPVVRRLIELRRDAAHAAANKVDTLLAWRDPGDGRVRNTLRFHGAGTGRWTGHGPQPQNFKRDSDDVEGKCTAIATGDLAYVAKLYSPLEAVGNIARAMICAAPGRRLLIGDFSGVESRVLAWIAGEKTKLDAWAKFDVTGDPKLEPYYLNGRACGLPEEIARDTGKTCDLAYGYQGGIGAWNKLAPEGDASTEDDKRRYQQTWRRMHPYTAAFWRNIETAALKAVRHPNQIFTVKRLSVAYDGSTFLSITLPSGRALRYPFPRIKQGKFGDPVVVFMDNSGGKWTECNHGQGVYGGLLTENIVQAASRDLLAAAMQRLEAAGYPVVLHVHDEVVCEVPIGVLEEFQRLLTMVPEWAEGLPIAAKVRNGERFSKPSKPKPAGDVAAAIPEKAPSCNAQNGDDDREEEAVEAEDLHDAGDAAAVELFEKPVGRAAAGPKLETFDQELLKRIHAFQASLPQDGIQLDGEPENARSQGKAAGGNGHDRGGFNDYPHGECRSGRTIAVYDYLDHKGQHHTRIEKKAARDGGRNQYPQSFMVDGKWTQKKPPGWVKIPYRLPELLAAPSGTDVYVPEGEKDADSVRALGLIATTSSEGATPPKAKISNWTPELNRWFHGVRRAFILEDNDEPGRKFAREKAQALAGIVPDIRIVSFPDVPDGEDVSWWLQHRHTKEELLERCEAAPRWQDGEGTLESVCASDVVMRGIDWLWPNRFAVGKIGIVCGLPDEGKGQILCYITSRVTRALEWPNGEGRSPQGNVVVLSAEEDPSTNLVPRLAAAGADLSRIYFIKMVADRDERTGQPRKRMFSLISDLEKLRRMIIAVGDVKAVLIDPVSAYLGVGAIDSYRDTDVRAVLGPLKELAEELEIAVVTVMHFNKKIDITNTLLRVSNSMAFVGLPRHAYGVVADPDNMRKLFVRAKNNDAAESDNGTLAFHFDTREVGTDPKSSKPIRAPFVVWEPGYVDITATEAMQAASESKSPGERDKAKRFVQDMLAGGQKIPANEIKAAAEANGLSWRTINRAKDELKDKDGLDIIVDKDRTKPDGKWFWKLETT